MTNHCHSRKEDYILQFFRNLNKHKHLWNYLSASPTPQQLLVLPCATSEAGMQAEASDLTTPDFVH